MDSRLLLFTCFLVCFPAQGEANFRNRQLYRVYKEKQIESWRKDMVKSKLSSIIFPPIFVYGNQQVQESVGSSTPEPLTEDLTVEVPVDTSEPATQTIMPPVQTTEVPVETTPVETTTKIIRTDVPPKTTLPPKTTTTKPPVTTKKAPATKPTMPSTMVPSTSTVQTPSTQEPTMPSTMIPSTTPSTEPPSTLPPGWKRTVIFLKAEPPFGHRIFYIGGIDHERREGCIRDAEISPCALPIEHNQLGDGPNYEAHNAWSVGDTRLDWYGEQDGQGRYDGIPAKGTPAVWTTNDETSDAYQPLNKYGEGYYMADFNMDCSETENDGWFEFKGWEDGKGPGSPAEKDMHQFLPCMGSAGGSAPYKSINHMARCGFINVFRWEVGHICTIDNFPRDTTTPVPTTPLDTDFPPWP